ncbi:MAG TPA: ATP-binding cassette domain-containing protein [Clostridia bacterium]|nr:ATP-binding cassette domain-containing protein [Clostridia bacterium]
MTDRNTTPAIQVEGIRMRFGADTVIKDITCTWEAGKIHGIVGRNGSGKTVLMKCICGFLRPTRGQARVWPHHRQGR